MDVRWQINRKIKLGVVADEFFDPRLSRLGGFGWAARQLAGIFNGDPSLGVELVYVASEIAATPEVQETTVHGSRVILRQPSRWRNARRVLRERFDLLLTIDYNLGYSVFLRTLPRTPCIVWVRDPWSPDDVRKVATLRIPGFEDEMPQGRTSYDGSSLARIAREARWFARPLLFATPAPHLRARLRPTYGVDPACFHHLPNPVLLDPQDCTKSERPSAMFLARLDPIKRPWLFAALARRFPEVNFLFLGKSHFAGPGSWRPGDLPGNVRLMGHIDEAEKLRLLSTTWVVVNTSIHEGLAVSLLEALACETPLLACQNPGCIVSRYGIYAGRFDGDGMAALDPLSRGLRMLITDHALRTSLGRSGRNWVRETHSRERFLASFFRLCDHAEVAR
jgi:glycosyltransferase involved in cell wall biosynthesis